MADENVISGILEDVQEEQTSEETPNEETQEEQPSQEPVITEEQAREWGLHHSFVGKPISELGKAYRNLTADYTRKSQKLKELEKPSQETQDILDDMPDPVEDIEGFKKWMKKQLSAKRRDPEIEEYIQQEKEAKILAAISSQLPDGVDAGEVIREWGTAGYVQNEQDLNYFLNRPQVFVNSVLTFYKAQELSKKELEQAKKKGDNEVKKVTKALRTKQAKASDLNSETRTRETTGIVGEILDDLILEQKFKE